MLQVREGLSMDLKRITVAFLIFIVSIWSVPLVMDLVGVEEPLAYVAVGSIPAFLSGMLMYSGVSPRLTYRW